MIALLAYIAFYMVLLLGVVVMFRVFTIESEHASHDSITDTDHRETADVPPTVRNAIVCPNCGATNGNDAVYRFCYGCLEPLPSRGGSLHDNPLR